MISQDGVNVFKTYGEENAFTNGLFSLLDLSVFDRPRFVASFLKLLGIESNGRLFSRFNVRVLRGIDAADAELRGANYCLRFETKIRSGCLTHEQVSRRLQELDKCSGRLKRVILLTPDDGNSRYIKELCQKYQPRLLHLEWRAVYRFLAAQSLCADTFSGLVKQFLQRIKERVFEQDFAGVITKVAFDDHTGVCRETYIKEMRRNEWDSWSTPRPYKKLDGTGRKLLLYEKGKGITAEVEIKEVVDDFRRRFPSCNVFARRPKIFDPPLSLARIRSVAGFKEFGKHRKDRQPYRNITREQYTQLVSEPSTKALSGNGE